MHAFNGRDFSMVMIGAFALAILISLPGCRKLTEQEMIERGLAKPQVEMQEDNVTRISSNLQRIDDKEKGVSCYIYDNRPSSAQRRVSCVKVD